MNQQDVLDLLELFRANSIGVVVDGGWGVDALLGEQTREHADLDLTVERKDVAKLREFLDAQGYEQLPRNDDQEYMFVLADEAGYQIDVHVYEFDAQSRHIYGIEYPLESLSGTGNIGGQPVKCIAAKWVIHFHTAYEPDQKDYHDVKLLCEKFDIPLPETYDKDD